MNFVVCGYLISLIKAICIILMQRLGLSPFLKKNPWNTKGEHSEHFSPFDMQINM
jgi:hypothetical protein